MFRVQYLEFKTINKRFKPEIKRLSYRLKLKTTLVKYVS